MISLNVVDVIFKERLNKHFSNDKVLYWEIGEIENGEPINKTADKLKNVELIIENKCHFINNCENILTII